MPKRCATPARPFTDSSGDESNFEGHVSDGYTSGAFNTDEDPYQLGSSSGTDCLSESDPLSLTPRARKVHKGIKWTRTFVSGPVDPVHNKFKFYCMLCKTNVSIFSKGAREILRHYKTVGHLRKDQKWRFTHLQETDEVTGVVTHYVRGKDGYVLTPIELEREKPLFIDAPLIEAGDRFPFYDDYMASIGGLTNPDDLRTSTLISLIGTFVPQDGNISLLRNLWTRVGMFTNHQALFSSFDWGPATLTVSRIFVYRINSKIQRGLWLRRPFCTFVFCF